MSNLKYDEVLWGTVPPPPSALEERTRKNTSWPKQDEDVYVTIRKIDEAIGGGPYPHRQYGYEMIVEKDPNGFDLKQPGAKADASKIPVCRGALHYFPRAIRAIAELSQIGARKYSWKGWENVLDGIHRYGDASARHELCIEDDYTRRDSDTGVLEATAVAWNDMARLELILREMEKKENETPAT